MDATLASDRDEWLAILTRIGAAEGYFQPVGGRHWALLARRGQTLLVTFDTIDGARGRHGQMPQGHPLAKAEGWSHLCLVADGATGFRDAAVFRYFDRLVDDAFFESHDRVLFFGEGAGGLAACAYAVAATGATVLAITPRASFPADSSPRYADAPRLVEGAGAAFLILDPAVAADARMALRFTAPNVTQLATRALGPRVAARLDEMGILDPLIELAAEGRLDRLSFARAWRKRRDHASYLSGLRAKADQRGIRCAPVPPGPDGTDGPPRPPAGPSISERLAALAAARARVKKP